ncbi:hypothetical protein PMI02_01505 [Novosphingobium sp. AP12]|nr:hypothetical protein PMI02_01505 [Novosphingobium sp. AP12]
MLPLLAALTEGRRRGVTSSALQAQLPFRYTFGEKIEEYPTRQSENLLTHPG